ncbi:hypothetical protein [Pseudomonas sp. PB3P13]
MNNMVVERKMPFYIVLFACLLVVLGDLRNVITPLGYWALWGTILFTGLCTGGVKKILTDVAFLSVTIGFVILIFSLLIASLVNADSYTAYQALKFIMIFAVLIVIFANCSFLSVEHFYKIAAISTFSGFVVFMLCKYVFVGYYIQLGDGRQGSSFAYPGVLWKTSAFFSAFLIAKLLSSVSYKNTFPALMILVSVFLLLQDSSRTGFLWLAVVLFAFSFLVFVVNTAKFLSAMCIVLLVVGVVAVFNLDIIYGLFESNSLLVVNRLLEGDPIRSKMITDGVMNAEWCLPLGCGFQSSTSLVGGEPMVIHNVYLAILGDLGVLGEIGLLIIVMSPLAIFAMREWFGGPALSPLTYYKLAACLGAACYCFILLFHPLSSEMSEWGYWAIMFSWLSRLGTMSPDTNATAGVVSEVRASV